MQFNLSSRLKNFIHSFLSSDCFFIGLLIVVNPIYLNINKSARITLPDTFAYLSLASQMAETGKVYLSSWGHFDTGVILPPLYPLLIAFFSFFTGEGLYVGEYVSGLCGILTVIPLFSLLNLYTNRWIAFLGVLWVQLNYFYFLMGMSPLTEALFLFLLSLFFLQLILSLKFYDPDKIKDAFYIGVVAGFLFLSRQFGIILLPFSILIMLVFACISDYKSITLLRKWIIIAIGFLVVFIPYSTILFLQTGQHAFQGKFKINIESSSDKFLDKATLKEVKRIDLIPANTYINVYAKRRLLRKLTPDGSEMLVNIIPKKNKGIINRVADKIVHPSEFLKNLKKNIGYLSETVGPGASILLIFTFFTPCLFRKNPESIFYRYILPSFIVFYLFVLSLISGLVGRYVYVIFPFISIHIFSEIYIQYKYLIGKFNKKNLVSAIFFLGIFFLFLSTPRYFYGLPITNKMDETIFDLFKKNLNHSPVLSLHPISSLYGGSFRIMPNDTLEKIVKYSKKTGVNWLVVDRGNSSKIESKFYTNAHWYWEANLEEEYKELVQFCCSTPDGIVSLYRIKSLEQ